MHWSFWFAAKWRGISCFLLSFLGLIGVIIAGWWSERGLNTQLQQAKIDLQHALYQQKIAQQQRECWQANKSQLQTGLPYIVTANSPLLAGVLQTWQETHPQRQIRFELDTLKAPSRWHSKTPKHIDQLHLRFWVQDEEALSQAWFEKKSWPCLSIVHTAQLSRAEEGGIWVEEESVCVQF
jgi:hypothetical protein